MAKLTILGCYGAYSATGGGTSSYLLQTGSGKNILIDCGSGAIGQLSKYINLADLHAVVLSHLHYDHICDILPLSYYYQINKLNLNVYMPFTDAPICGIIKDIDCFNITQITDGDFCIQGCNFSFNQTQHTAYCLSMLISLGEKVLFYTADCVLCPALDNTAKADFCILDCGSPEGDSAPHLSISQAATLKFKRGAVKIVSHLNSSLDYTLPQYAKLLSQNNFILAEQNKTFLI